jgi:hypothetical protein
MEHEPAVAPVVASTSARVTTWTARQGKLQIRVTDLENERYLVEIIKGYGVIEAEYIV